MQKILGAIFLLMVLVLGAPAVADAYVGNANTRIFHDDDCRYGKMIKSKVHFAERGEATGAGYRPCKQCSP